MVFKKSDNNIINIFEGAGVVGANRKNKNLLDLMKDLNSKVVLVVGNYLGSVSHTLSAIKTFSMQITNY